MDCVILAAGAGKRMERLTRNLPKPMIKILEKPILEYILLSLPENIKNVVIVIGYKGDIIEEYFGRFYRGKSLKYVRQGKLLGTGKALHLARGYLKGKFLVLMGDDFYSKDDIKKLSMNNYPALLAFDSKDNSEILIDSAGFICDMDDYGKSVFRTGGLINTGAYLLDDGFFKLTLSNVINSVEYGIPQTLVENKDEYPVKVIKTNNWQPVGMPEEIVLGKKWIKRNYKNL